MAANTNDFGHFRKGELLGYQNGTADTGDFQFYRRGAAFPAALGSTSFAQSLAATASTGTWSAPVALLVAGAATLLATAATGTWAAGTGTLAAGAVTITATPATGTWGAAGATLTSGALILAASPATGTWAVAGATLGLPAIGLQASPATGTWAVVPAEISGGQLIGLIYYTGVISGHPVSAGVAGSAFPDFVLPLRQGDDEEFQIDVQNGATGAAVNLTGWGVFTFTLKRSFGDADAAAVAQISTGATGGLTVQSVSSGRLRALVARTALSALPRRRQLFFADLQAPDPSGRVKTIMSGVVELLPQVTDS